MVWRQYNYIVVQEFYAVINLYFSNFIYHIFFIDLLFQCLGLNWWSHVYKASDRHWILTPPFLFILIFEEEKWKAKKEICPFLLQYNKISSIFIAESLFKAASSYSKKNILPLHGVKEWKPSFFLSWRLQRERWQQTVLISCFPAISNFQFVNKENWCTIFGIGNISIEIFLI